MPRSAIRHVRPVIPVDFPPTDPEWEMGETMRHQKHREILRDSLRAATGEEIAVGSDQFVYIDARDAKRKCAPDAFLKLGVPDFMIRTWKTWERGTPDLCCEIVSPSDNENQTLEEKLDRFHEIGVAEVVAYDPDAPEGHRVRAWDLVHGDLVERVVDGDSTPCLTLGLWFVLAPAKVDKLTEALRLAEDADGHAVVRTPAERAILEKETAIVEKEAAIAEVARLRKELLARRKGRPRKAKGG